MAWASVNHVVLRDLFSLEVIITGKITLHKNIREKDSPPVTEQIT